MVWGSLRGVGAEDLHVEARKRVSDNIMRAGYICVVQKYELWLAANKNTLRRRTMMWRQREVPELRHWTTVSLLQWRHMRKVDHLCPQTLAARTMGYSSFHSMLWSSCSWDHRPWNHGPWP